MAHNNPNDDEERILETEPKGDLDPPRRPPPTAVGTGTPNPEGAPQHPTLRVSRRRKQPVLIRILSAAVGIVEDAVNSLARAMSR